jgi:hypothetical protein
VPNHLRMINAMYHYLVLNVYYVAITEDNIIMLPKFRNINSWDSLSALIVFKILVAFTSMFISIGTSFAIDRSILS